MIHQQICPNCERWLYVFHRGSKNGEYGCERCGYTWYWRIDCLGMLITND